ncbi:hypothetical protein B0H13DRAFT_2360342 [Mycena leptocephala]|nr:hypothetical protein B0H13DRAFT_2360342 [Mycena leptocephala]
MLVHRNASFVPYLPDSPFPACDCGAPASSPLYASSPTATLQCNPMTCTSVHPQRFTAVCNTCSRCSYHLFVSPSIPRFLNAIFSPSAYGLTAALSYTSPPLSLAPSMAAPSRWIGPHRSGTAVSRNRLQHDETAHDAPCDHQPAAHRPGSHRDAARVRFSRAFYSLLLQIAARQKHRGQQQSSPSRSVHLDAPLRRHVAPARFHGLPAPIRTLAGNAGWVPPAALMLLLTPIFLVSLADISPFPASALQPRLTLPLTPTSPAPLPTPAPFVHPCSPRKRRVVLLSRACAPRDLRDYSLRSTNTGSPATIWEPSSLSGPHSHNLHTPAFLSGPARAAAIAYRAMLSSRARESLRIQPEVSNAGSWLPPAAISGLSSRAGIILRTPCFLPGPRAPTLIPYLTGPLPRSFPHLHLSLPPPLLVLLCRPTPFPLATRISYSRESRLSSASRMTTDAVGDADADPLPSHAGGGPLPSPRARVLGIEPSCAVPLPLTRSMPHRLDRAFHPPQTGAVSSNPVEHHLDGKYEERLCVGGAYLGVLCSVERRERTGSGVLVEWWCRSDVAINSGAAFTPTDRSFLRSGTFCVGFAPSRLAAPDMKLLQKRTSEFSCTAQTPKSLAYAD